MHGSLLAASKHESHTFCFTINTKLSLLLRGSFRRVQHYSVSVHTRYTSLTEFKCTKNPIYNSLPSFPAPNMSIPIRYKDIKSKSSSCNMLENGAEKCQSWRKIVKNKFHLVGFLTYTDMVDCTYLFPICIRVFTELITNTTALLFYRQLPSAS